MLSLCLSGQTSALHREQDEAIHPNITEKTTDPDTGRYFEKREQGAIIQGVDIQSRLADDVEVEIGQPQHEGDNEGVTQEALGSTAT